MRHFKEKSRLQTKVDVQSDPAFNSDDGYETRHANPSDEKEIVEYKTGLPYDSDIATTQKNIKDAGGKFDPIPFLAQQSAQDVVSQDDAQGDQESSSYQNYFESAAQQPTSTVGSFQQNNSQEQATVKTAVKTNTEVKQKVEAKTTAQTKSEKMNSFVQMRKSMMSNWGTK